MKETHKKIRQELDALVKSGEELTQTMETDDIKFISGYQEWYTRSLYVVHHLLPDRLAEFEHLYHQDNRNREKVDASNYTLEDYLHGVYIPVFGGSSSESHRIATYMFGNQVSILRSVASRLQAGLFDSEIDAVGNIKKICKKFHTVAMQLRKRHDNRQTLEIKDEYDVQDLLHPLLKICFDDVRPEAWVPEYAGGSSRIDFLLKKEKIAIEVKKTRKNLTAKEIGAQLLIDIARYNQHPDCKILICFIYDPEERIGNPRGLENDLNQMSNDNINVITIIKPF